MFAFIFIGPISRSILKAHFGPTGQPDQRPSKLVSPPAIFFLPQGHFLAHGTLMQACPARSLFTPGQQAAARSSSCSSCLSPVPCHISSSQQRTPYLRRPVTSPAAAPEDHAHVGYPRALAWCPLSPCIDHACLTTITYLPTNAPTRQGHAGFSCFLWLSCQL